MSARKAENSSGGQDASVFVDTPSELPHNMFGFMNIDDNPEPLIQKQIKISNKGLAAEAKTQQKSSRRNRKHQLSFLGADQRNWRLSLAEEEKQRRLIQFEDFKSKARTWIFVGDFRKAIEFLTKALEVQPEDSECLNQRASCHMKLYNYQAAVDDAHTSLDVNPMSSKTHALKAEALYLQGEFELSLVHFHRAHKLRSNIKEYERGIEKAKTAIENSIGERSNLKLEKKGDLSYFTEEQNKGKSELQQMLARRASTAQGMTSRYDGQRGMGSNTRHPRTLDQYGRQESKQQDPKVKSQSAKTVKQLLGELYGDWQFLDKILNEEDILNKIKKSEECNRRKRYTWRKYQQEEDRRVGYKEPVDGSDSEGQGGTQRQQDSANKQNNFPESLQDIVQSELRYLEQRTEFWRQNKPGNKNEKDERQPLGTTTQSITQVLEEIQQAQEDGNYEESLSKADEGLHLLAAYGLYLRAVKRNEYEATLNSYIGVAYYELEDYESALAHHETDLAIANKHNIKEAKSRALYNIGRVYAKTGKYSDAIKIFEAKLPLAEDELELTWLHHELGRCYLERGKPSKAVKHGKESLKYAEKIGDRAWKLNATVLIAQAKVSQERYEEALKAFSKAMEMAKEFEDEAAEQAIQHAMADLKNRKSSSSEQEDTNGDNYEDDEFQEDEENQSNDTVSQLSVKTAHLTESQQLELSQAFWAHLPRNERIATILTYLAYARQKRRHTNCI